MVIFNEPMAHRIWRLRFLVANCMVKDTEKSRKRKKTQCYSAPLYNIWHLINRLSIHVNVLYFYDRQIRFFFITRSIHIQKKHTNNNNKHIWNLSHGSRSVMAQKITWTIERDYSKTKYYRMRTTTATSAKATTTTTTISITDSVNSI